MTKYRKAAVTMIMFISLVLSTGVTKFTVDSNSLSRRSYQDRPTERAGVANEDGTKMNLAWIEGDIVSQRSSGQRIAAVVDKHKHGNLSEDTLWSILARYGNLTPARGISKTELQGNTVLERKVMKPADDNEKERSGEASVPLLSGLLTRMNKGTRIRRPINVEQTEAQQKVEAEGLKIRKFDDLRRRMWRKRCRRIGDVKSSQTCRKRLMAAARKQNRTFSPWEPSDKAWVTEQSNTDMQTTSYMKGYKELKIYFSQERLPSRLARRVKRREEYRTAAKENSFHLRRIRNDEETKKDLLERGRQLSVSKSEVISNTITADLPNAEMTLIKIMEKAIVAPAACPPTDDHRKDIEDIARSECKEGRRKVDAEGATHYFGNEVNAYAATSVRRLRNRTNSVADNSEVPKHTTMKKEKEKFAKIEKLAVSTLEDKKWETNRRARILLKEVDKELSKAHYMNTVAQWEYETNITEENKRRAVEAAQRLADTEKAIWIKIIPLRGLNCRDATVRRQLKLLFVLGMAMLPPKMNRMFQNLVTDMQMTYSTAEVCDMEEKDCDIDLNDLTEIFRQSRNAATLQHYWQEWSRATGEKMRDGYEEYVELLNIGARLNNFTDAVDHWLKPYETENFPRMLRKMWLNLRPLYLELHAYVRRRLRDFYGEETISARGSIPVHLLGDLWGQEWTNIYSWTAPYPSKVFLNMTHCMKQQDYTVEKMLKLAEDFFVSLGLKQVPHTFWNNSIFKKPNDRDMVCHASAWDFNNKQDFRIKMCCKVNMHDLLAVHHEMGHIQYFLQYKHQPFVFRTGANPGFHEAIGDVIALSVSTPKHLSRIGLLKIAEDEETDVNFLYMMALSKVAFLPYAYLVDLWRWDVFQGEVPSDQYNSYWWELREEYQGVRPPTNRSERDFDPGGKYHIAANVPYTRYFVSTVTQFQFHRALCRVAGEYDPKNPSKNLHKCDIYNSKKAGSLLRSAMKLGFSKPWPEVMKVLTGGEKEMDASALRTYFLPLERWLKKENKKTNEIIGWTKESPTSTTSTTSKTSSTETTSTTTKKKSGDE